jgi:hypothetical protein
LTAKAAPLFAMSNQRFETVCMKYMSIKKPQDFCIYLKAVLEKIVGKEEVRRKTP